MASAVRQEILAPIAYAVTFLITIILTKAVIAYAFHRASGKISPTAYRGTLSLCGIAMLCFSAKFVWDAYNMSTTLF